MAWSFEEAEKFPDAGHGVSVVDDVPSVWHQLIVRPGKSMIACSRSTQYHAQDMAFMQKVFDHDLYLASSPWSSLLSHFWCP